MEVGFVAGRPRALFSVREIDFAINNLYRKSKPRGSVNFRPGSNPNQRYRPMAQAKRKNTTKPSRLPRTGTQIYKQALPRMEYIIATLATCVVADGWHESWESGP